MNAIIFYRVERWLYCHKMKWLAKVFQGVLFYLYGSVISPSCEIGKGTYFSHMGRACVIVGGTRFGERCVIGLGSQCVRKMPYKEVPVIKDDVWIGPGAILCGPIIVESHVIVAPNAVVTKSVREGCIVGGIPARVIGHVKDLDYNILDNPKHKEGVAEYLEW